MKKCTTSFRIAILLFWLLASTTTAFSAVIFVKHDAAGANNGSSWANAFTTLQPAINVALSGDEIWVAAGTYFPTDPHFGGGIRNRTFYIAGKNIQLYGGFDGLETMLSERDVVANLTILSGELGAPGNSDNALHVMWLDNVDNSMRVDGFTITGGNANILSFPSNVGGGIFNDRFTGSVTSPTLANCSFNFNSAFAGGALYNYGFLAGNASSPQVLDCVFSGNHATSEGGGAICNVAYNGGTASPLISNCVFSGNTADEGGAILNYSNNGICSPNITGCTFSGNVAGTGGGIGSRAFNGGACSPTISICSFSGNQSTGAGGAISNFAESGGTIQAEMSQLNFIGNTAATNGGCIQNYGRDGGTCIANLRRCTFTASTCATAGGLYNTGFTGTCTVTLENCLFADCIANPNQGGAVYNNYATLACTNCTFAQNHATAQGGAVHTEGSPDATSFINCIFWGNTGSFDPDISTAGVAASLDYCLVSAANCGAINASAVCGAGMIFNQDPLFINAASGDFQLQNCSPANEAGTNAGAPGNDLNGNPRPFGTEVDMGAFEVQTASPEICNGMDDDCDGLTDEGGVCGYCPSSGTNSQQDWIKKVKFKNQINNNSGNNGGYADFTALSATVEQCEDYEIKLKPGFNQGKRTVHWRVWIDFNQDLDFNDPGEKVLQEADDKEVEEEIDIPNSALLGATRMRVSMKRNNYPTPCELFNKGEVEDYTIIVVANFAGGGDRSASLFLTAREAVDAVTLYGAHTSSDKPVASLIFEKSADDDEYSFLAEIAVPPGDESPFAQIRDAEPLEGLNFYRLQVRYADGTSEWSEPQVVHFQHLAAMTLFPNPASEVAWLYLKKYAGKKGTVQVFDCFGRLMSSQDFEEIPAEPVALDLKGLKDGMYSVTVEPEGFRMQVRRLVVVR